MNLSLAQICSTATSLLQGRTDITLSTASLWANLAYQEVATRIRYFADEGLAISSTTSGENTISLPTDFLYPIALSNLSMVGDFRTLRQVDAEQLDSESTQVGTPVKYALYGVGLQLWPSPDSAYSMQLRYGKHLESLVSSTATPAFDERYHLPVAYLTASMLAATVNDLEAEATNKARYLSAMGSTPNDQAMRQRDKLAMRVSIPSSW